MKERLEIQTLMALSVDNVDVSFARILDILLLIALKKEQDHKVKEEIISKAKENLISKVKEIIQDSLIQDQLRKEISQMRSD
jgi:hypothetical protein